MAAVMRSDLNYTAGGGPALLIARRGNGIEIYVAGELCRAFPEAHVRDALHVVNDGVEQFVVRL